MIDLTEEQLETIIFNNIDKMNEKGLPIFYENTKRQFRLPSTKIIDILTWEIKGETLFIRVIELKKDFLFTDAIVQVLGYFSTIKLLTEFKFKEVKADMVLIGKHLNPCVKRILNKINYLSAYQYKLNIDGISFSKFSKDEFNEMDLIRADKLFQLLTSPNDSEDNNAFDDEFQSKI